MKVSKTFLTLAVVGFMTVLLCFPASVFAKGPNPPSVPSGFKKKNGPKGGVLFLGFINTGPNIGDVEAVLYLDGYTYYGLWATGVPESLPIEDPQNPLYPGQGFKETIAVDITQRPLPCEILVDFGIGICGGEASAVVFEERDVSNFQTSWDLPTNIRFVGFTGAETYDYGISCEVDVSFIVPTGK